MGQFFFFLFFATRHNNRRGERTRIDRRYSSLSKLVVPTPKHLLDHVVLQRPYVSLPVTFVE